MNTTAATLNPEFDHVYGIDAAGHIVTPAPGIYAPDVQHDDTHDVLVNYRPAAEPTPSDPHPWRVLTGHTGQYGYRGAVMHPSELWSPCHLQALTDAADAPGVAYIAFAVVEVRDENGDYPDGDAIGWAVAYREVPALTPEHLAAIREAHTLSPNGYCRCGLTPTLTPAAHAAHVAAVEATR